MAVLDLVAVPDGAPVDTYAGVLVMSRVADKTYNADKLHALWQREGLDESLLPKQRQPVHDFQNACRSVAMSRRSSSERDAEVKVDEVDNKGLRCVYVITRMTRDRANLLLKHENEMRVSFRKNAPPSSAIDPIQVETVGSGFSHEHAADIEQQIRLHYNLNRGRLPGASLRTVLRDVLLSVKAIPWVGGKAYFVARQHTPTIEAVERVFSEVCGDNCDFETVPCADAAKLRAQIDKYGARAVKDDVDGLIARLADVLRSDKAVDARTKDTVLARRATLGAMRKQIAQLIGKETDAINAQIRMLDEQIDALMDKANEGRPPF